MPVIRQKTTASQRKASRKWEKNNPQKNAVLVQRRIGRMFIRKHATLDDLDEYENLINEKRRELIGNK